MLTIDQLRAIGTPQPCNYWSGWKLIGLAEEMFREEHPRKLNRYMTKEAAFKAAERYYKRAVKAGRL